MSESTADTAKRLVGRAAADLVPDGSRVGFGTGSTFVHVLDRLAERRREEGLEVAGVPTSEATATRARELGIPLLSLDEVDELDLAIDGADEVDPSLALIKGGGGALTREKIVAAAARELIVIVHASKMVNCLGAFPLPVEVLAFGERQTRARLETLGATVEQRTRDGAPFVTDNGHHIFDCQFDRIENPSGLAKQIATFPGVVEHGLFVDMATQVLVAEPSGEVRVVAR